MGCPTNRLMNYFSRTLLLPAIWISVQNTYRKLINLLPKTLNINLKSWLMPFDTSVLHRCYINFFAWFDRFHIGIYPWGYCLFFFFVFCFIYGHYSGLECSPAYFARQKHTYVQRSIKQRAIFTNIHIKLETGPDGNSNAGSKWRAQWGRWSICPAW